MTVEVFDMNQNKFNSLKNWFFGYASGFHSGNSENDYAIKLKQEHTERVCQNIVTLGIALGLDSPELILAETMALFHDIGRFKQYIEYGTFNDRSSDNHARIGLRQIAAHSVFSGIIKREKYLITNAIAWHNSARIPENKDKETLFFIRLLRDADKLDIWKIFMDYYHDRRQNSAIVLDLPDHDGFSNNIIDAIRSCKIARMEDMKSLNDFKLLQISWVFDLNFTPSFKIVKDLGYVEKIEAFLPKTNEIIDTVKFAREYVAKMLQS